MRARKITPKKSPPERQARGNDRYKLSVLFIEDTEGWSAQVLEHDIATQADTLEDLFYEVERILISHVALATADGRAPFEGIPPAPTRYWEIFRNSEMFMRGPRAGLRQQQSQPPKITKHIRIAGKIAA